MSIFFHLSCFFLGSKKWSHLKNTTAIFSAGLQGLLAGIISLFRAGVQACGELGEQTWWDGKQRPMSSRCFSLRPAGAMELLPLGSQWVTAAEEHSNAARSQGSARQAAVSVCRLRGRVSAPITVCLQSEIAAVKAWSACLKHDR